MISVYSFTTSRRRKTSFSDCIGESILYKYQPDSFVKIFNKDFLLI